MNIQQVVPGVDQMVEKKKGGDAVMEKNSKC